MFEFSEQRASDSPFVQMVWHVRSTAPASFMSVAATNWEMVITRYQGTTSFTVRGPETTATLAEMPADAEFFGIIFKLGTYMPQLPVSQLVNGAVFLPEAASRSFWLHGSAWHVPNYENADTFVEMMARQGMVTREPVVEAALAGQLTDLSLRSVQRRFLNATGMTHGTVVQIERARRAVALLDQGVTILDTVDLAGYADQPHLTRSLRRYFGTTPSQLPNITRSP
jgi:AraC-like DNA-binding protein